MQTINSLYGHVWTAVSGGYVVLNAQPENQESKADTVVGNQKVSNGAELARNLNKLILNLYSSFLSEDGKYVDYLGMSKSKEYQEFVSETFKLPKINLDQLTDDERKAFFLNIYNSIVIQGYIQCGVPTSSSKKTLFYQKSSYKIGPYEFSLDDIEHGILRGNKKHPAFFIRNPQFGKSDPRGKYSVKKKDPRIHFALVCGAQSCPPIRLYSDSNLERGLETAAQAFCNDEGNVALDVEKNEVGLSQIFEWYFEDFASTKLELLRWILQFLNQDKQKLLKSILESDFKVTYLKYNWNVNTKGQLPIPSD